MKEKLLSVGGIEDGFIKEVDHELRTEDRDDLKDVGLTGGQEAAAFQNTVRILRDLTKIGISKRNQEWRP